MMFIVVLTAFLKNDDHEGLISRLFEEGFTNGADYPVASAAGHRKREPGAGEGVKIVEGVKSVNPSSRMRYPLDDPMTRALAWDTE